MWIIVRVAGWLDNRTRVLLFWKCRASVMIWHSKQWRVKALTRAKWILTRKKRMISFTAWRLRHVHIGGQHMTADPFVNININAPSFDEWTSNKNEHLSVVSVIPNEDDEDNDLTNQDPRNLVEAINVFSAACFLDNGLHAVSYGVRAWVETDRHISREKNIRREQYLPLF
jgi:hypothetical protein